ncbi:MAG: TIGR04211 family SH3 domain-containing protein [Pseudomonadota bacterium]
MIRTLIVCALLFTTAAAGAADVKYVTDNMPIMLRTGPSNQHKIIRTLPSGAALNVLESSENGEYLRVRTENDLEGWVLSQYLVDEPTARLRLAAAEAKLAKVTQENETLKKELSGLKGQFQSTQTERNRLDNQSGKLQQELEELRKVAARPAELDRENREIKEELIAVKNDLRIAQDKNRTLESSAERQWFAIGAIVLFSGMVLGLIIPRIRWRKRNMWSDL